MEVRESIPWDEALEGDKLRSYRRIVDDFRFILTKGNGKSLKNSKVKKSI